MKVAIEEIIQKRTGCIVQEYMPEIGTYGEFSFVAIDLEHAYTFVKVPRKGDPRVQTNHGGRAFHYDLKDFD